MNVVLKIDLISDSKVLFFNDTVSLSSLSPEQDKLVPHVKAFYQHAANGSLLGQERSFPQSVQGCWAGTGEKELQSRTPQVISSPDS